MCYAFSMKLPKNIPAHLTALLSGAGAVLTVIHPGFKMPPFVEGLLASLCVIVSAGVELFHIAGRQSLEANLVAASHFAGQVASAVKADATAATTPATPAAPTTPAPTTPAQ